MDEADLMMQSGVPFIPLGACTSVPLAPACRECSIRGFGEAGPKIEFSREDSLAARVAQTIVVVIDDSDDDHADDDDDASLSRACGGFLGAGVVWVCQILIFVVSFSPMGNTAINTNNSFLRFDCYCWAALLDPRCCSLPFSPLTLQISNMG